MVWRRLVLFRLSGDSTKRKRAMPAGKRRSKGSRSPTPQCYTANVVNEYESVLDLAEETPLRVQGNLTGLPRRLRDGSADWYNLLTKWRKAAETGFHICQQIANIKKDGFEGGEHLPEILLPLSDELTERIDYLHKLLDKCESMLSSIYPLRDLLEISATSAEDEVIFQTWTIDRFVETYEELSAAFHKDFILKENICERICHCHTEDEVYVLLAAWAHKLYITDRILTLVNAMAWETGHDIS